MENILSLFKPIKHFIFDIDGVLTDGTLIISADGTMLRSMNIKDGYAMQLAIKKGFVISIISGAKGEAIEKRLTGLGIDDIHLGIENKIKKFEEVIRNNDIALSHILYMGDDMPDKEVMKRVALPCCPSDACPEIKAISKYISPASGGNGCVRDVIEKVLKLNDCWE
jgi:3-deoxy-D-manno-octulosonate 8-phosphate phosphatase (KDO 8-P phosphatase)